MKENIQNQCPPILLIIFNRPDLVNRVFARIRDVNPRELFIAADGPRVDVPSDNIQCELTREIVDRIDWDCNIHTLFHPSNLGCKKAPPSAISWFFKHVESGIILEDDCVPNPTFFRFCTELLSYYQSEERVMSIGGNNFQNGRIRGSDSYYFSVFGHSDGWATWKRAWQHFDPELLNWPNLKKSNWIRKYMLTVEGAAHYTHNLDMVYEGRLDSWAFAWTYSRWCQNGLSIVPNCNLVTNIGTDERATHTKKTRWYTSQKANTMEFPLRHPSRIIRNKLADKFTINHYYLRYPLPENVGWFRYIYSRLRKKLPNRIRKFPDRLLRIQKHL